MIGSLSNLVLQHTLTEHLGCSKYCWAPRGDWGSGCLWSGGGDTQPYSLEIQALSACNSFYLEYKGPWERSSLPQGCRSGKAFWSRWTPHWASKAFALGKHPSWAEKTQQRHEMACLGNTRNLVSAPMSLRHGVFSDCPRINNILSTLLRPSF